MSTNRRRGRYITGAAILFAGAALSLILSLMEKGWEQRNLKAEFDQLADDRCDIIHETLNDEIKLLYSACDFFAASKEVEREEFRIFTERILRTRRNTLAINWNPLVPAAERPEFEARARAEGFPNYRIVERGGDSGLVPAGRRDFYFPIYFVEPLESNRDTLGFDGSSEPARWEAIKRTRDTGEPAVSGRIKLLLKGRGEFGCRVFLPIYREGAPHTTPDERRSNIAGFLSLLFIPAETIEAAVGSLSPSGLDIYLIDETPPPPERLICYQPSRVRAHPVAAVKSMPAARAGLCFKRNLDFGGRRWTIACYPSPEYLAKNRLWQYWFVLGMGLAVTVLLTMYILNLQGREARVRSLVDERTAELKESTEALRRIEWLLTKSVAHENLPTLRENLYIPPYGDLSEINTDRTLLDAVGLESLFGIASDYLDLLKTSAAIYERNGDYALGIFSSGWCQFLDCASRQLCNTDDNREALASGKWLCHESCWTEASRQAIATGQPIDIECNGGIRLYAIPVIADGEAVGSINFGYGDPPRDVAVLRNLAEKYQVSVDELVRRAHAYETRPPYIIGLAKARLHTSAKLIGEIVERNRVQRMLAEARERLAVTLNSIGDGVIAADTHGTITLLNRVAQTLTGWSEAEALGRPTEEVFHIVNEKTRERCPSPVERVLARGAIEGLGNSTVLIARDGNERILADSAAPIRDRHGSIIGVVLVFRDITELKRAQDDVARQAEVNATFAGLSKALVSSVSIEDISRLVMERANQLTESEFGFVGYIDPHTGYFVAATLTKSVWDQCQVKEKSVVFKEFKGLWGWVLKNKQPAMVNAPSADPRSSGVPPGHVPIKRFLSAPALIGGKLFGQVAVANSRRDYTERDLEIIVQLAALYAMAIARRRDEDEIKHAAQEWLRTFDSITDFIFIQDKEYTITKVNSAFARLLKRDPDDIIGKKCYEVLHGKNEPWPECPFEVTRKTHKSHTVVVEDPRIGVPLIVTTSPLFDTHGEFVGSVHLAKDIAEAKKAERELREALEVKSSFVSMVSHELRTPLTAIKEGIGLVIDGIAGRVNEKQKEFLGIAKSNVDRLARLINAVLDFQKLEAGKIEFDVRENNLNETIREVCATMLPVARERGLELSIQLGKKLTRLKFDRDSIVQVLTNIIDNAIKYTERGRIIVSTIRRDNVVDVLVQDTGTGIHPEDIPRLFHSFEQLTKGKYMKSGGTGLGLAISKQIIDAHRGKIWVESTPGVGSTFHFVLPLEERRG